MGSLITSAVAASLLVAGLTSANSQTPALKADDFKEQVGATLDRAVKRAQSPSFNSFYWKYDYDGTDASLIGIAEQPGRYSEAKRPQIYVQLDCSRQWVRLVIKPTNIGQYSPSTLRSITIDDGLMVNFDGDNPIVVSTADAPKRGVIKLVSQLTRAFYTEKEKRIALSFRSGQINVDVSSATYPQLERRDAIVSFREKCSFWWSDF